MSQMGRHETKPKNTSQTLVTNVHMCAFADALLRAIEAGLVDLEASLLISLC